ncbi:MAG TPA: hypothetical protein VGH73_22165 [Thermoanaerobaculia bacterium]|jgi:hypothetical protein
MRHPRPATLALFALWFLIGASLLLAVASYTIVLKDGATIIAKEKYRIENGRAIITQLNGIQTFVRADQIDVARTEAANRGGYGSAVVLPGSPQDIGAPPPQQREKTLSDLAKGAAPRDLPTTHRDKGDAASGHLVKTKAGFYDLSTLTRRPYSHAEATAELQQFFRGQGVQDVEIFEGTQGDHPLLEIATNSEGSVFKALTTTANALLHVRDAFPGKVAAFEVVLTTPSRERAGQFVLTPEMATDLISKKVEVTAFYVKNVQF